MEWVILVNQHDQPQGVMEKIEAHRAGILHRAFSVFIFNSQHQLMLQQRSREKYHSPKLWTNTCCSHQRQGETNQQAGQRRLQEEMGFSVDLVELFTFIYKSPLDHGMTEHEFDHVMAGTFNGEPTINRHEVMDWKWMDIDEIVDDMQKSPERYTTWFQIILSKYLHHLK